MFVMSIKSSPSAPTHTLPEPIIAARARLLMKQPFFASHLLTKCDLKYDPAVKTAQTDGKTHTVGDWFCGLHLDERLFLLAHETLHDILGHHLRGAMYHRRGFGPDMQPFKLKKFKQACDYYVNAILTESNVGRMPHGGLLNPQYGSHLTVDQIYEQLPDEPDDEGDDEGEDSGEPGDQPGEGQGKGQSHGGFDDHLEPPTEPGTGSPQTEQELDEQVKANVASAAAAAKAAGKGMGGGLAKLVGDVLEPKVPWDEEARQFCIQVPGRDDTTWSRINRRRLCNPPYVPYPGRDGHEINSMVIAVDASGSIGPEELGLFMGEMRSIMETLSPRETWVLWWDTGVNAVEVLDPSDLEAMEPIGGGGTDYTCVPKWLADNALTPDLVVCMTDGYVYWPDPSVVTYPHLTISTSSYAAPFGKTIHMN